MRTSSTRPESSEYTPYHAVYVDKVPDGDILAILRTNGNELDAMFASVAEERGGCRYAEGKWSIREIIGHIIDAGRHKGTQPGSQGCEPVPNKVGKHDHSGLLRLNSGQSSRGSTSPRPT